MAIFNLLINKYLALKGSDKKLDTPILESSEYSNACDFDVLLPPKNMLFDGSTTQEEFKMVGEGFTRYFLIAHAQLKPNENILDVGCGIGQKALALAKYLNSNGSYDGIDIVPKGIKWCAENYKKFPNFRFQLADLYSAHYNPKGKQKASEYRFPYEDETFDLVFLSSVFTHMLPKDMENYFSEIARVLRKGGRSVTTYFLLNPESLRRMDMQMNTIKVPFIYESEACRIANNNKLETTVAHDEQAVRRLYEHNGMSVTEITYGSWCGRKELVGSLQDVIIAVKE
ncbi:MAG: class I SAM-dependent methyltransferase [Sulfuricella sp.]|nr:class I SAM-dependent methyltransferase [Sulfuricella sp.]